MATKAKATKGTQLKRGDGGGTEVFTKIGEVIDIDGPNESVPDIEATSFDSTAEEFVAGLPTNGEMTLNCNFVGSDAQQQGLRTDKNNGTLRNFQLVLNDHASDPTTVSFAATVKELKFSAPEKNIYKLAVTLKLSGATTWDYAPA